jgi:hypothetical protein
MRYALALLPVFVILLHPSANGTTPRHHVVRHHAHARVTHRVPTATGTAKPMEHCPMMSAMSKPGQMADMQMKHDAMMAKCMKQEPAPSPKAEQPPMDHEHN